MATTLEQGCGLLGLESFGVEGWFDDLARHIHVIG